MTSRTVPPCELLAISSYPPYLTKYPFLCAIKKPYDMASPSFYPSISVIVRVTRSVGPFLFSSPPYDFHL